MAGQNHDSAFPYRGKPGSGVQISHLAKGSIEVTEPLA
jgi:hypothetical protein